jgi:hypothetical protein
MQGIVQKLQGEFTDDTLPRYYPEDPRINKGTLALFEPGHPTAAVAGLSNNLVIPNIAKNPASILTGANEANLSAIISLPADASTSGRGLYERSAKGGIHGIVSQDKTKFTSQNNHGVQMRFDQAGTKAVLDYVKANPTHLYYMSTWLRLTRLGNLYDDAEPIKIWPSLGGLIASGASSANDYLMLQSVTFFNSRPNSENLPNQLSRRTPVQSNSGLPSDTVGPIRLSSGRNGINGVVANVSNACAAAWGFTQNGTNQYNSTKPAYPSYIFYSFYLEDCTMSGRTLAEADAADLIHYNKEVITVGGRYYGDTFTDPSTLP